MIYLAIFVVVWVALIILSILVIPWPREARAIRDSYPGIDLLRGFFAPEHLMSKMSNDHRLIFDKFRRRYLFYWLLVFAVLLALSVAGYLQIKEENSEFIDRMQEEFIDK